MRFEDKLIENLDFGRYGLNFNVFEKLLISYSCISFLKYYALRSFLHKIALFFKNLFFPDFWLIEPVFRSIEIAIKIFGLSLPDSIDVRSILDRSQLENFQFLFFDQNIFSCIICVLDSHALHCFCIHLAVLQLYFSLFSHITCIHFATLGTQLDQKLID